MPTAVGGHPISQQTNAGFNRRREPRVFAEDFRPAVAVAGSGWEERKDVASCSAACPRFNPPAFAFDLTGRSAVKKSDAAGVGQFAVCAASGTPPDPNAWFGSPFSPSLALGVPPSRAASGRHGSLRLFVLESPSEDCGVGQFGPYSAWT
jgi:hypothetical protein